MTTVGFGAASSEGSTPWSDSPHRTQKSHLALFRVPQAAQVLDCSFFAIPKGYTQARPGVKGFLELLAWKRPPRLLKARRARTQGYWQILGVENWANDLGSFLLGPAKPTCG